MYTEATGNPAAYSSANSSLSVWDEGLTQWDFNGNTYISVWDESQQSYAEQNTTTVIWAEQ